MGIDPDLQAMLEDLRSGIGDPRPERDAAETEPSQRALDWEIRTGYGRHSREKAV